MMQIKPTIIAGILLFILFIGTWFVGYHYGKKSVKCESETVYIPGETIHDTITNNIDLVHVVKPNIDTVSLLQYCIDNGLYQFLDYDEYLPGDDIQDDHSHLVHTVDTMAIIGEFLTINQYHTELFDIDTVGKCSVDSWIQYNQLKKVSYEFTPIQKVLIKKKSEFNPFVGGTIGTIGYGFRAGIFMPYGFGIGASYIHQTDSPKPTNDLMIDIYYKF